MSNSSGKRIMTTTRQCCLGILTARMTPTAQTGRKSWYMSASRGKIAFARAGTPKGKFENNSFTFFLHLSSLRRATSRDLWRFQSWTGLQQRHTICIGARKDNYTSSMQGVDRFSHIVEVNAEHGYQQHTASLQHPAALGLWSTLPQGQSASWARPTRTRENSSAMEILSHPRVCNPKAGAETTRDNPVWSSTRITFALHTSMASV